MGVHKLSLSPTSGTGSGGGELRGCAAAGDDADMIPGLGGRLGLGFGLDGLSAIGGGGKAGGVGFGIRTKDGLGHRFYFIFVSFTDELADEFTSQETITAPNPNANESWKKRWPCLRRLVQRQQRHFLQQRHRHNQPLQPHPQRRPLQP